MIPSLFSQVVAASPAAHKFEPTYAFKEDSQPMRLFRRMDEEPESLWSVERIMETFNLPGSSSRCQFNRGIHLRHKDAAGNLLVLVVVLKSME